MKYADGTSYDGEWQHGEINGHGIMTYANGTVYDGQWKDGRFYGPFTFTRPDGSTHRRIFDHGLFLPSD